MGAVDGDSDGDNVPLKLVFKLAKIEGEDGIKEKWVVDNPLPPKKKSKSRRHKKRKHRSSENAKTRKSEPVAPITIKIPVSSDVASVLKTPPQRLPKNVLPLPKEIPQKITGKRSENPINGST